MTRTSYAQNFEDILLWRALKDAEDRFYIDIGAQDPILHSVSLLFYNEGWRGVHVEPVKSYADALRKARPDEIVLEAAVGTAKDVLRLFEVEGTGLSTSDAALAESYRHQGRVVTEANVKVVSLLQLLEQHKDRTIQWLKIDVEGGEQDVIESWGASTVRPRVLVIESTRPNSQEENWQGWEPGILERGYRFVYFDGLNRYYCHSSHASLAEHFRYGPSIFDDFSVTDASPFAYGVTIRLQDAYLRLANESRLRAAADQHVADQEKALAASAAAAAELQSQVEAGRQSAEDLARQLSAANAALAASQATTASLQETVSQRDEQISELKAHAARGADALAKVQAALDARNRDVESLKGEVDGLKAERDKAAQRIEALAGLETELELAHKTLDERTQAVRVARDDVSALTQKVEKLGKSLAEREVELDSARADLEAAADQEAKFARAGRRIADLLKLYRQQAEAMHRLHALVSRHHGMQGVAVLRMRDKLGLVERIQASVEATGAEIGSLSKKFALLADKLQRSEGEVARNRAYIAALESAVIQLGNQKRLCERRAASLRQREQEILASTSWRITAPVRGVKLRLKGMKSGEDLFEAEEEAFRAELAAHGGGEDFSLEALCAQQNVTGSRSKKIDTGEAAYFSQSGARLQSAVAEAKRLGALLEDRTAKLSITGELITEELSRITTFMEVRDLVFQATRELALDLGETLGIEPDDVLHLTPDPQAVKEWLGLLRDCKPNRGKRAQ